MNADSVASIGGVANFAALDAPRREAGGFAEVLITSVLAHHGAQAVPRGLDTEGGFDDSLAVGDQFVRHL